MANLLTTAGASRVIAIDLHVPQIQGFFDIPMDHLTALTTLADYFRGKDIQNGVIVAPDVGRAKLAEKYAKILRLPLAIMHKRRNGADGQDVEFVELVGDVKGKTPIIIDDEIATGGSIYQQAQALAEAGAEPAYVSIAHAVLVGPALERLRHPSIREVVTTDTIPIPTEKQLDGKIKVLSIAPLLAEAILRVHQQRSVSQVFRDKHLDFAV